MDLSDCWAMASLISCVIWLVMGSRANTIAHATSVVPLKNTQTEELRKSIVISISTGCQIALEQCKEDFQWERWNCPDSHFARRYVMPATKEMAYVASITAAGVTYAVARSCAKGDLLLDCKCLKKADVEKLQDEGGAGSNWDWENCASDLRAGQRVSDMFLRALEEGAEDIRAQANHHNYKLGMKVVELGAGDECKCHGVSGSCTSKTCWGRVAPFPKVGRILKERYQKALRVAANRNLRHLAPDHDGEMIFLEESPDYCKPNTTFDWPGTEGRVCSRRRLGQIDRSERRSCRELCRSCGHQVRRRPVKTFWRCNCTFQWCCNVTCSTCTKNDFENYCDATPSLIR